MFVIGLTGGIGSGKTTVSGMLAQLGAVIIDADQVARKVVEPGSPLLVELAQNFGDHILLADGSLNRVSLGELIFQNKENRELLNQLTHPVIIKDIKNQIKTIALSRPNAIVVIEAPLLIEAGMVPMMDEVWIVVAEEQTQIERIMSRDGFDYEDALQRVQSQMPAEDRLPYGDVVISTDRTLEEVNKDILNEWERLHKQKRPKV